MIYICNFGHPELILQEMVAMTRSFLFPGCFFDSCVSIILRMSVIVEFKMQ